MTLRLRPHVTHGPKRMVADIVDDAGEVIGSVFPDEDGIRVVSSQIRDVQLGTVYPQAVIRLGKVP